MRNERTLRELYRRSQGTKPLPPDAGLEARLLARQRTLYPRKREWTMNLNPRLHPGRAVLALTLLLLVGIGACSVPSSYDVEVGQAMAIQFSRHLDGTSPDGPELQELLGHMDGIPGVENVMVNERINQDGTRLDIMLSGRDIDADRLAADLAERFPMLAQAEISYHPIEQTVEGPLYERLAHDLFGWEFEIEVTGDTPEEIRQQILEQLAAEGFDGDADVDVIMDDEAGTVEIKMELEAGSDP